MERIKKRPARDGGIPAKKERKPPFLTVSPLCPLPILCFYFFGARSLILPALFAALAHECGHIAAILLCGGRVTRVSIEPFGGEIVADGRLRSYRASIFISLAGALVNLLSALVLLLPDPPEAIVSFGTCSLFLAAFNLLPLRGLDGGDVLADILRLCCPLRTAERILRAVQIAGAVALACAAIAGALLFSLNPTLILLSAYLLFTVI